MDTLHFRHQECRITLFRGRNTGWLGRNDILKLCFSKVTVANRLWSLNVEREERRVVHLGILPNDKLYSTSPYGNIGFKLSGSFKK